MWVSRMMWCRQNNPSQNIIKWGANFYSQENAWKAILLNQINGYQWLIPNLIVSLWGDVIAILLSTILNMFWRGNLSFNTDEMTIFHSRFHKITNFQSCKFKKNYIFTHLLNPIVAFRYQMVLWNFIQI